MTLLHIWIVELYCYHVSMIPLQSCSSKYSLILTSTHCRTLIRNTYLYVGIRGCDLVDAGAHSLVAVNRDSWRVHKHWWVVIPQDVHYEGSIA